MAELLVRGPDSQGRLAVRIGEKSWLHLIHTRLSIIDTSDAGRQPMLLWRDDNLAWHCEAGDPGDELDRERPALAIVYNGEIYNYRELREELRQAGHVFTSQSDTEVILRGYAEWGGQLFKRLDGMFSLVIYDSRRKSIIAARDHLGIKPLYAARKREGSPLFASQVRAIKRSGIWAGDFDRAAIGDYLRLGSFQEPSTVYQGIEAVAPGSMVEVRLADGKSFETTRETYWRIEDIPAITADDWIEAHEQRLKDAVRDQLVADVPVGVFLSGGLDSTLLLQLACGNARDRLTAVTVGGEFTVNNEAAVAARTAANLGVKHVSVALGWDEQQRWLGEALGAMDQPSCDGMNTYVVSRAAKGAGLVVALGGTGADELHGAYGHMKRLARICRLGRSTGPLRPPIATLLASGMRALRGPVAAERVKLLLLHASSPKRLVEEQRRFFTPSQIAELWPTGAAEGIRLATTRDANNSPLSIEGQVTAAELRGYLLNTLLRDSDWATMANQQEFRVPFLGRRYMELMLRMPIRLKSSTRLTTKPVLSGMLSAENRSLVSLPKRGFTVNYSRLLTGTFREQFHASSAWLNTNMGFQIPAAKYLETLQANPSSKLANRYWSLFTLGYFLSKA
jgi:asparagine synthase (glutamine-hydrolysing)